MHLTSIQTFIIICMVTLGTMVTRFLPFIVFKDDKRKSPYIEYLGTALPYAAIGLLVVYCLKGVNVTESPFGFPEFISIACITLLHYWKENTLLSIGVGTALYMILVQVVFV